MAGPVATVGVTPEVLVRQAETVGPVLVEERVVDEIHTSGCVEVRVASHLHGEERFHVVWKGA